jgi:hypothetical protein
VVQYGQRSADEVVPARSLLLAALGTAGLAACITMLFLGMRAVMDIGGSCANGGPYVSAHSCPDGASAAMLLGILGLFLFGAIAGYYGTRVGGLWTAIPLLAWCWLFLSLGWNFLDYGLFNPPGETGVELGFLIPGVLFVLMGGVPLAGLLLAARNGSLEKNEIVASFSVGGRAAQRRSWLQASHDAAESPLPDRASDAASDAATDGLEPVRHLERLAEMRRQGLLNEAEYDAAKATVVRQMEDRS